jgi:sulfate adenylyltransferase subunit 1
VARSTALLPRRYLGRVESGSIAVGDTITVLPSGVSTRVREIHGHLSTSQRAGLHAAVALVLDDAIDISRGDMLVHGGASPATRRELDATLCWLSERPLDRRRSYFLRHTTREVRARIDSIDHLWDVATQTRKASPATLQMNDIGRAGLKLAQPIFVDRYANDRTTGSFILIDETTNNTVAAGLIQ